MNIVCDQCQSKFNIPENKIPSGKTVTLKCPKCENRIPVSASEYPSQQSNQIASIENEIDKTLYDAEERPFNLIDESIQTALVCETDDVIKERIYTALSQMNYQASEAADPRTALKNMRYHVYDLILVNETFGTTDPNSNGILIYMDRMGMAIRRNIFVALLTNRFRTMDQMTAFNKSVDLIINIENINELEKILTRGIKQKEAFYRIFKETMRKAGKM